MPSVQDQKNPASRRKTNVQATAEKGRRKRSKAQTQASFSEQDKRAIGSLLDDVEAKLRNFGKKVDQIAENMEEKAEKEISEFEDQWRRVQVWLLDNNDSIRSAEEKAETLIDTAVVRAQLGKMEARELVEDLIQRIDHVRVQIDGLLKRTSNEASGSLKKLSDAFFTLRHKLLG